MTAMRLHALSPLRARAPLALLALLLAALSVLPGCRTNREADALKSGPELVYERARKSLDDQDFDMAIRVYEALVARFPFAPEARQARLDLIENGRGTQALHDTVVALRANRRTGSANTKTKAEVDLSGKKPWRQKGTGRARAGYKSSPVWRGGGVVFGPKPRDYSKKVGKATRRLALRKALSGRVLDGDVLVVPSFAVGAPKTKEFLSLLGGVTDATKVLIIADRFDENTLKAARNVGRVRLVTGAEVNSENLLDCDKVVVTEPALAQLAERTTK